MDENQMQELVQDLLALHDPVEGPAVANVRTFEEAGILTMNAGVVVRMEDDSEFQLTIVQSQHADDDAGRA